MERPDDNPRGKRNIPKCSADPQYLISSQARQIKQCMNTHTECISYEILRRESQASMDPSQVYKMKEDQEVKGEAKTEKAHKRERLIINPEFVESLDQGDGAQQFDEDYYNNEV